MQFHVSKHYTHNLDNLSGKSLFPQIWRIVDIRVSDIDCQICWTISLVCKHNLSTQSQLEWEVNKWVKVNWRVNKSHTAFLFLLYSSPQSSSQLLTICSGSSSLPKIISFFLNWSPNSLNIKHSWCWAGKIYIGFETQCRYLQNNESNQLFIANPIIIYH